MASLRNPLFTLDAAPSQETMQALANDGKSSLRRGWEAGRLSTDINALAADEMSLRANGDVEGAENLRLQRQGLEAARAGVAPQVQSLAQVNSLGSGLDWLAGQVGQGTASMVEPIVAGGGIQGLGRLAGMTKTPLGRAVELATQFAAPAAAYGINQRQLTGEFGADVMNDPTLAGKISAQELNRQANAYGLGAAALDTLPQMGMARRLVGAGTLRALDRMPLGARVGLDLAGEGATEALQTGGSQLMKSGIDPNRDTSGDRQELIDSFAGGFAGAGPMSLASNAAQAGHDRLGKTADVIGEKAGDVADLATGTVTEAAQKGKGLLARAMGVFRRGEAAGEDLGDDAAPEAGKAQGSGVQFDKADIDYLNSVPEGVDPMDDLKSRVKMAQRYLPQFQDDPEAQDLLAQIQEGARAGDIDMLGSAVDAASTKIAQRHNQDDLIRRAEQGTPAEQLARIAGGLATRGVKAAAKGAFKVGKAAVEGVTAAATKKNMQGAEQTGPFDESLGDTFGAYLGAEAQNSTFGLRTGRAGKHFERLGQDFGDLVTLSKSVKSGKRRKAAEMAPQIRRAISSLARDMDAAFGRDGAITRIEAMKLMSADGHEMLDALRDRVADETIRSHSVAYEQDDARTAMEMMRLLPDKARAELAGSAQLRTEFLGAVDRVATGRATAKQRQLLEQAVGGPKVLNGLLSAYSGRLEDPEEQAEQGGEKTAAAIDDEDGEGESEQFGEDYEAGKQSGAEKALANGAAPKLYGFDKEPTLRSDLDGDPFAPRKVKDATTGVMVSTRPTLFEKGRRLYNAESKMFDGPLAAEKKIQDVIEKLGDKASRYNVSAKPALDAIKERGMQPGQIMQLFRDYLRQEVADDTKRSQPRISMERRREMLSDAMDAAKAVQDLGEGAEVRAVNANGPEFNTEEQNAPLVRDKEYYPKGRARSWSKVRPARPAGKEMRVPAARQQELMEKAMKFFAEREMVVAEQLSDRLPDAIELPELMKMAKATAKAVDLARKPGADKVEIFDNNNILTFKRGGKDLNIRADDLVRWAGKQRQDQGQVEYGEGLRNVERDAQYLSDLSSGISAVMSSGLVDDVMPFKITYDKKGNVVEESFADGVPPSLHLATTRQSGREFAKNKVVEELVGDGELDSRPAKVKRVVGLYEGGKRVGEKEALVDNPERDARGDEGYDAAVARQQDRDYFTADPLEGEEVQPEIQPQEYAAMTAEERAQYNELQTPEARKAFLEERGLLRKDGARYSTAPTFTTSDRQPRAAKGDSVTFEKRDGFFGGQTQVEKAAPAMVYAGTKSKANFTAEPKKAAKVSKSMRWQGWNKEADGNISPLDFFDQTEEPEVPDEFADQRYTSGTQGFDAARKALPPETKAQALNLAERKGEELMREGFSAIATRLRTAQRSGKPDANGLVGGPHYVFAAAYALNSDRLSKMDLSPTEAKQAIGLRAQAAKILQDMPPKEALAGARLLFGDDAVLGNYRKLLAAEASSSPVDAPQAQVSRDGRTVAIIGTAGRDKTKPLTAAHWESMLDDLRGRLKPGDKLVSGGAAWADHLAVAMFLEGKVKDLTLHLPAPIKNGRFEGPNKSAGSAANYYHDLFKRATGIDGIAQIEEAVAQGAKVTYQPVAEGYGAMFKRNSVVAKESQAVVAYTWGEGDTPDDGGTKNTWDQISGERAHVPIGRLGRKPAAPKVAAPARDPAYEKEVMGRLMDERYDFKTADEVDKFLKTGYAMWQRGKAAEANLRKQRADLEATEGFDQAKHAQLNKAIEMIDVLDETFAMGAAAHTDLGSFYDGVEGEWKDDKEARAMLKGAAPEVAAQAPKSQGAPSGARKLNAQGGRRLKDGRIVTVDAEPAPAAFTSLMRMVHGEPVALVARDNTGKVLGRIHYMPGGGPIDSFVEEDSRRIGVGLALYDALEARGVKLPEESSGVIISDDARALRSARAARNAQTSTTAATGDNSQEAIARADAYLRKVLPGVRLEFANLTGYSGEWIEAENLIRISTVSAPGAMQTAYHEALHAFFSKFVKANPEAKRVLASLVNHGPTLDRLVALLNGHPAAQAQLADAEERLAYAYQFWAAGLLDLPGTSGKGFFAKVKKFLRRVAGAISDHERAADILIAFHEGKLAQPSAAGQVIGKIIAQGTMNLKARRKMDRTIQWAYSRVAPAETVLARSPSVTAQKLAKEMFTNPGDEGAAGVPEGYLNARRTSYTRFNNRMARVVKDLGERDSAQVLKYLQDEAELADIPFAPHREAVREIRKLLRDFYDYSVEKGVKLEDRGEKYFPIVWDFEKLADKRAEFINLVTTKYGRDGEAIWNALTNVTDPARDNKRDPDRADGVLSPFFAGKEEVTLDFFEAADRQKFLQDTLVGTLSNYFHQGARNAEYTHRFGEKGEVLSARLNTISQELRKHAAAELAAGRFADKKQADEWAARQFQLVEDSVGAMEGSLGKDTAQGWRKATSWLTAYQNLRLLPLTLFASFVDPLGMVARGATMREAYDSFLRGMREVFTQWGDMFRDQPKQRQLDRWEKLAEDIGAVDAVMLSHHVAEEYSSGYMAPGAKKVNDWLFRLNGMEAWNRGMRVGATKAATRFIVQHATRPEFHSERWLKELNLTKDDVHLDADGELVLSPKALEATGMSKDQARETALKLRNALNRWVEGAVLTPNAAQRPAWASDPRWSFMFHLKQFSYSFHQTLLKRAVKEMNHGNLAPMGAFAWYVPAMMASDITKGLIQGGGSLPTHMQGWTLGDHVMHGIERAGFLGIGAVGVDASQDIWSLGGPAIEQVIDAMVDPAGQTVLRAMPLNGVYAELVR